MFRKFKSAGTQSRIKVEYPCDAIIVCLIAKGHGDYATICNMDFYNAIMTVLVYNAIAYEEVMTYKTDAALQKMQSKSAGRGLF